ncbi:MAG: hypothetical protein IPH37_07975 [Burkholderiales bacterium]|nr:hypothetical protein [Burkholderiales bacterium]
MTANGACCRPRLRTAAPGRWCWWGRRSRRCPALAAQGPHPGRLLWVATTLPAQRLWAAEQALRCADVDAVLAWLPQARPTNCAARKWPLPALTTAVGAAPRAGASTSRPRRAARVGAWRSWRMRLRSRVLKRRGPPLAQALHLHARSAPLARLLAASQREPVPPPVQKQEHTHALDCRTAHA